MNHTGAKDLGEHQPQLVLFNSMTKTKEVFEPLVPGKVGMYVCGVTPYDYSHVGHARAYVAFDVLYRYLNHLGYEVLYVRNFTDIDDKIIKRANECGESARSLSSRFINEFLLDMEQLLCLPPNIEPRVTDHIEQIIDMIGKIIENDVAYAVDGDVYFDVAKFPNYLCLSGRKLDDNLPGGGGRGAVDSRKHNPADFALWKAAKEGEPFWESPWGPGRPGWHIECSVMSMQYLGHAFDIHGGGKDLIFPHHENELAQSRAACPDSNIQFWMHNGFVNKDNEKMSKSLGNFFTIRDITARYHPIALRFFLMRTHYRSDVNFSDKMLELASERVYYLYQTLYDCDVALSTYREEHIEAKVPEKDQKLIEGFLSSFLSSMSDDLRTTNILDDLMELLRMINSKLTDLKKFKGKKQQQKQLHTAVQYLIALERTVCDTLKILGLMPSSTFAEVLQQLKEKALGRAGMTEQQLQEKIEERTSARLNKQYEESDRIRKELTVLGIALMDEPTGTVWRPCEPECEAELEPEQSETNQPNQQ